MKAFSFFSPLFTFHSAVLFPCYSQVVPKSHKYFSLPAGKSLDSKFPPVRLSHAGKRLKPPLIT